MLSSSYSETWGSLNIKGNFSSKIEEAINSLFSELERMKFSNSLTVRIDDEIIHITDLKDYIDINCRWSININKLLFSANELENSITQFFFYKEEFKDWSSGLDPFNPENPLNINSKVKIVVCGIEESFGGAMLLVTNEEKEIDFGVNIYNLPTEQKIYDVVHVINNDTILNPVKHLITFGSVKNSFAVSFLRNSASVLTACLISEFYSKEKIILRGIKRIQLELIKHYELIDLNHIHDLAEVVSWVYEDKVETRIKLFLDRITLDIDFDETYTNGIVPILKNSYQQAKERYNFVIIERKDQYLRELADLLKDVKAQSELYSAKIRSLLGNLLRDVLAGFLLVGFSFFTKISELTNLSQSVLINFVFKGLAIYFIGSAFIQAIVNLVDINISDKEMRYWKNLIREYMPQVEFEEHINKSLSDRRLSIRVIYPVILVLYLAIAILCWKFPEIWLKIGI